MSVRTCSNLPKSRSFRSLAIPNGPSPGDSVVVRHVGIPGFDQSIFSQSKITLVGAGGINSENGEGFVRKGIAEMDIFDGDDVDLSNLNRQRFTQHDVGKNKAISLAGNLTASIMTKHEYTLRAMASRMGFRSSSRLSPATATKAMSSFRNRAKPVLVALFRNRSQMKPLLAPILQLSKTFSRSYPD